MRDDEYPPEARFAWDMIDLTETELHELRTYADAGMIEEADSVVNRAEDRMFGSVQ